MTQTETLMFDNFPGDNAALIEQINSLLSLDAKGVLVPHGIGGLARSLLTSCVDRLSPSDKSGEPTCAENAKNPTGAENAQVADNYASDVDQFVNRLNPTGGVVTCSIGALRLAAFGLMGSVFASRALNEPLSETERLDADPVVKDHLTTDHFPGVGNMIPPGWKLVPIEPDEDMESDMLSASPLIGGYTLTDQQCRDIYNAAIAASPAPPSVEVWQPIETAPKDREIMLYYTDWLGAKDMVISGHWDGGRLEGEETFVHSMGTGDADMWANLPTPPAILQGKGEWG